MIERFGNVEVPKKKTSLLKVLAAMIALYGAPAGADAAEKEALKSVSSWSTITHDPKRLAIPERTTALESSAVMFKEHLRKRPGAFKGEDRAGLVDALALMEAVSEENALGTKYELKGPLPGGYVFSEPGKHGNGVVLQFVEPNSDGNGFHTRYVLVTARHVADVFKSPGKRDWVHHQRRGGTGEGADASVVELTEQEALKYKPLFLSQKTRTQNVDGEIGSVVGTDTDAIKSFPSLLSPRLTESFAASIDPGLLVNWKSAVDQTQAGHLRMILIPHREVQPDAASRHETDIAKIHIEIEGISGSCFCKVRRNALEFGGLTVAAGEVVVEGKKYAMAFIVDHQIVWETIDRLPKPPTSKYGTDDWRKAAFGMNQ